MTLTKILHNNKSTMKENKQPISLDIPPSFACSEGRSKDATKLGNSYRLEHPIEEIECKQIALVFTNAHFFRFSFLIKDFGRVQSNEQNTLCCHALHLFLEVIMPGEEWTVLPVNFRPSFRVIIKHGRTCVKTNPVALVSDVYALICGNSTKAEIIIYTEWVRSFSICVVHWFFAAQWEGKRSWKSLGFLL